MEETEGGEAGEGQQRAVRCGCPLLTPGPRPAPRPPPGLCTQEGKGHRGYGFSHEWTQEGKGGAQEQESQKSGAMVLLVGLLFHRKRGHLHWPSLLKAHGPTQRAQRTVTLSKERKRPTETLWSSDGQEKPSAKPLNGEGTPLFTDA